MSLPRIRDSLQHVQYLYDSLEDRSKLENLVRAFRGIQALPPTDPNSFFVIAGYHGLNFRGPGETDADWWGGYCWHDTVLFPTWHRAYLLRLEDALRSIPRCQDVTLPFWDELLGLGIPFGPPASQPGNSLEQPIPSILTSPTFDLDGRTDNPLYSYKLRQTLNEEVKVKDDSEPDHRYTKHEGYETVRYPLSGLVGTDKDRTETEQHNAAFPDQAVNIQKLNDNVTQWLRGTVDIPDDDPDSPTPKPDTYSVHSRFIQSLFAPNYTVFSNTTSQNEWIKRAKKYSHWVVSLESPHNAIHLSIGGFYEKGEYNASPVLGANGDMGDNETAAFDPIFWFHHCFIDYAFSVWQKLWHHTKRGTLTVIPDYEGTILKVGQPPNYPPGTHLDMTTPLLPFEKPSGGYYTSHDVTDLDELGIIYVPTGSLDLLFNKPTASSKSPFDLINTQLLDPRTLAACDPNAENPFPLIKRVYNIDRAQYEGSFVVRLYARGHDGKEVKVGREAVLSRWNAKKCRNCQSHLEVVVYVPIDATTLGVLQGPEMASIQWRAEVHAHDGLHTVYDSHEQAGKQGGAKVDDL